jgi:multiple sugar transport system substrate-binding protein
VVIDHPFMGEVARKKCFLPLDEHVSSAQLQELENDSVGPSYSSYYYEGHQWALPVDAAAQVAGYRADLLERAGLDVPETWEQVLDVAKLRRGFVSAALFPLDALICFFSLCANLGEPPFTGSDAIVTRDIGQEALERLRLLAGHALEDAKYLNPIAIWERMASSDDIGYCPFAFGYSNYARKKYRDNLVSFGVIPSSGRGPVGATLGGTGLAVSQKCKHRETALAYALWVTGKLCQRTLYVESGGQPASKAAWLDTHANEITNRYFASTLAVLENAWVRPRFAGFERFQVLATTVISHLLQSNRSSAETLAELDKVFAECASS